MISNIQILRAFAAINVVLFHIIGISAFYGQPTSLFKFFQGWGANGVDIFFVISGFVMLHTQYMKRKTPIEFLKGRLVRIVPIYWVLTIFVLLLYVLLPAIFKDKVITPMLAVTSLLFSSTFFGAKEPVIYVGWTLEWEMLFYIVFSIGMFINSWRLMIAFVATSLSVIALLTNNLIVFEFLFGMLAAYLYHQKPVSNLQSRYLFFVGIALLSLSLNKVVFNLNIDRLFMWGIPAFLIVMGLVSMNQLKSKLLSYLGDASYSIYLVQILTIPAFYKVIQKLSIPLNNDVLAITCLASSIAFGCIVYAFIEAPITQKIRKWL